MSTPRPYRDAGIGLVFVAMVGIAAIFVAAQFSRAFDAKAHVTLLSDRAGLLMEPGLSVKLRGVVVGRVVGVHTDGAGARLDLELKPKYLDRIPANVAAQLVPPTLFGAKYVELELPAAPVAQPLRKNSVIDQASVSVEVSETFAHLAALLEAAPPAKVNAALNALAGALRGRGEQAGQFIDQLSAYLHQINPSLPTLSADVPKLDTVLSTYADVAPALLAIASNITTTSDTIVTKQAALDAFLLDLTSFSHTTTGFLRTNADGLVRTLDVLAPTTRLLARYSPVLPCMLRGLDVTNQLVEPGLGGARPGLTSVVSLLPPRAPYQYPYDLPVVDASGGPVCDGLPTVTSVPPHLAFGSGRDPYASAPGQMDAQTLARILFGTAAGVVTP